MTLASGPPVALVIHRRIRDEGFAAFSRWQVRIGERLQSWPGFLGQEIVPPAPPASVDWTIVQRFADADSARAWLADEEHARLVEEISPQFVGQEDMHLLPDVGARPRVAASAMISFSVAPADEAAFVKWQGRVQAAEAKFAGFLRHKLERPVPGVHDDWLVVLNFDSEAHLSAWLASPERRALLAEGGRFGSDINLKRSNYGFDFWFPAQGGAAPDRHTIFKSNLLVLLVLYPVVFLWTHFVAAAFLDPRGVPFWLGLFVGNIFSTQVVGWWAAPAAFKLFDWWRQPAIGWHRQAAGYGALLALYAIALAACALLQGWRL